MILVYTTCESAEEAKKIGKILLQKKLCACINIIPNMESASLWPPKSGKIEEANEVVLVVKTLESKYQEVEDEIKKNHSYDMPCIFSIPILKVSGEYSSWVNGELK